jgi:Cu/Ag efflux protein CusF
MKPMSRFISVLVAALLLAALAFGQAPSGKKQYTFHGKVVSVDKKDKSMRVDGEKVEGWMNAMTMDYKVDNPSVIDKVKPGDRIMATVYDGDYSLHNVKVMGAGGKK